MRRMLLVAAGLMILANAGCFLNEYSSNPVRRMQEMMNESENLRQLEDDWSHFWMNDQPSHLTADRTNGSTALTRRRLRPQSWNKERNVRRLLMILLPSAPARQFRLHARDMATMRPHWPRSRPRIAANILRTCASFGEARRR